MEAWGAGTRFALFLKAMALLLTWGVIGGDMIIVKKVKGQEARAGHGESVGR